jgi:F-type H+-transporting ATPase subunit gamma
MSDTTYELGQKLASAGDLQSVVRSMKALAAASVGQYEEAVQSLADYYGTVERGLSACFRQDRARTPAADPAQSADDRMVSAIVFGSDQGLVGQFNDVIADYAIDTLRAQPGTAHVWAVGERVHARLSDGGVTPIGPFSLPNAVAAITPLVGQLQIESEQQRQASGTTTLWVFHNRPLPGAGYAPAGQQVLPLDAQWQGNLAKIPWPTGNLPEVLDTGGATLHALVREYLFITLFRACAESLASENASRLSAMQRAEKNITDLLDSLHSEFNQLRQTAIDQELFDLVSGFEALRNLK